jgi:hypothetical protein
VVERGRVVAVTRSDGSSQPCDVAVVAAGAWTAGLLAPLGVRLPIATRALQMLLTEAAPAALDPVIGAFDRKLSLKQLETGAYLIGGGWPADITDEPANAWTLRPDSVSASLAVAREIHPPTGRCALARGWAGLEAFTPDDPAGAGPGAPASTVCWWRRDSRATASPCRRRSATSWRGWRSVRTPRTRSGAACESNASTSARWRDRRADTMVQIYALCGGYLELARESMIRDATPSRWTVPISCFLIVHPRGRLLFDTGLHCDDDDEHAGPLWRGARPALRRALEDGRRRREPARPARPAAGRREPRGQLALALRSLRRQRVLSRRRPSWSSSER